MICKAKQGVSFAALFFVSTSFVAYASADASNTSTLWNRVEQLSQAAGKNLGALTAVWPNVATVDRTASRGKSATLNGGSFDLTQDLRVTKSRIRTENRQKLVLAEMDVKGRCITRDQLESSNKSLKATPPPTNPLPEIPRFYALETQPGVVLYGFSRTEKGCLSKIVLRPTTGKYAYTP